MKNPTTPGRENAGAPETLAAVARMLSEWEGSSELTTDFAARLVTFIRSREAESHKD